MKTKNKVLIGLLALCLAGSIGSALALTRTGATGNATTGTFDQAVYLYWGSGESKASLSDVEDLVPHTPQYRYLTVSPKSTKTVAGTVTVSFTMEYDSDEEHIEGLTVSVYDTGNVSCTDQTVVATIGSNEANLELSKGHLSGSVQFSITATNAGVNETIKHYAMAIEWDGTNAPNSTKPLGASLTISQSFALTQNNG